MNSINDIFYFYRTLREPNNIGKVLIKLSHNESQLNIDNSLQYVCDEKNSYLIYGKILVLQFAPALTVYVLGGSSDNWTDTVEWLVLRGARKIVVASESKVKQAHISRRLNLLKFYYNADIKFSPTKLLTKENAIDLLSEVYKFGSIGAVFLLPSINVAIKSSEIKTVQYLDMALRSTAPKALLINFLRCSAGICQSRADAGFETFNVQWQQSLHFNNVISALGRILKWKSNNVVIKDDKLNDNEKENEQASAKRKLSLYLAYIVNRSN